jgi:hypothetical protein
LLFEAHDEIELLFLLHHLGGHVAADGGLIRPLMSATFKP